MTSAVRCNMGLLLVGIVGVAFQLNAETFYVKADGGSDGNGGKSPDAAFATIQKAIDSAASGDKIMVYDGVYPPISCDNVPLTIESVNGPGNAIIDGGETNRVAGLDLSGDSAQISTNTVLRGFTVRNGYGHMGGGVYGGTVEHCTISNNVGYAGGAAYGGKHIGCFFVNNCAQRGGAAYRSDLSNCVFVGNVATNGGAICDCLVSNSRFIDNMANSGGAIQGGVAVECLISNNVAIAGGGGAYYSYVKTSLITCNRAEYGAGTYNGTNDSCVISKNIASDVGGGTAYGRSINCTVFGNTAGSHGGGLCWGTMMNSIALGNIAPYSAEVYNTKAFNSYSDEVLEGPNNLRGGNVFVAADSADFHLIDGAPCIDAGDNAVSTSDVDFYGGKRIRNGVVDIGAVECQSEFRHGIVMKAIGGIIIAKSNMVTHGGSLTFSAKGPRPFIGFYTNQVFATAESTFIWTDICESGSIEARFDTSVLATIYVDGVRGDDQMGMTAELPVKSINRAIEYACDGDTIVVRDGVYEPIAVPNLAILIRSENGPETTIIDAQGQCRCATLAVLDGLHSDISYTDTVLSGFTLRGGISKRWTNLDSGHLTDCYGGGVYGGTLINCVIEDNYASYEGGGAYSCVLKNCKISNNKVGDFRGGGASRCEIYGCSITGNSGPRFGGGVTYCYLYDSVVAKNKSRDSGGGIYGGTAKNCTIVDNVATNDAGGVYNAKVFNCILWGNFARITRTYNKSTLTSLDYCCIDEHVDGHGNIFKDPQFVDYANGDYSLLFGSPCIDAGDNKTVETLTDYLGNPRIVGPFVDMGAIEYATMPAPGEKGRFNAICGGWSIENDSEFAFPTELHDWDAVSRFMWRARDKFFTSSQIGVLPPSNVPILISLGTFSFSGIVSALSKEDVAQDVEYGVPVWHVRIVEEEGSGDVVATVGGVEVSRISAPFYNKSWWVESVYGNVPEWLDSAGREKWYAERMRTRVEAFMTLVPSSLYNDYLANVEKDEESIASEDLNNVLIRVFSPNVSSDHLHLLNVRAPSGSLVNAFGSSNLAGTNWTFSGIGAFTKERSSIGLSSEQPMCFYKLVSGGIDSDGDGISDILETTVYGTDPAKVDSSGGGLTDWEKIYRYDLNPRVRDTSGDGIDDDEKIAAGADPRVAVSSAQAEAAKGSIRYYYDDDDRLTGTYVGLGGASTTTKLTPAGNPKEIRERDAAK